MKAEIGSMLPHVLDPRSWRRQEGFSPGAYGGIKALLTLEF